MTASTINNQMVEALRRGSGTAAHAYLQFGMTPEHCVDLVEFGGSSMPSVTSRSLWFWSHQAPVADAVEVWWGWIDRRLRSAPLEDRVYLLADFFKEGMEAALPQESGATVRACWKGALGWVNNHSAPGWDRGVMMGHLASLICKLGNGAVPGISSLHEKGLLTSADWSDKARSHYAQDPMTYAVSRNQVALVEFLLRHDCGPSLQDGTPIIAQSWKNVVSCLQREDDFSLSEDNPAALMFEKLLEKGLEWNIPCLGDPEITIAHQAEKFVKQMKEQPEYWGKIARLVEARLLNQATHNSTRRNRSHPRL